MASYHIFFLNPGMFIMSYKAIHDLAPAHPSNLTSCQFILCSPHDGPSLVLKHNKQILHTDPLFSGMLFSSCSDGSLTIWMCERKCYSLWRPFLAKTTLTTIPFLFCLQGIYHHLILDTCLLSVFSIRTSVPWGQALYLVYHSFPSTINVIQHRVGVE